MPVDRRLAAAVARHAAAQRSAASHVPAGAIALGLLSATGVPRPEAILPASRLTDGEIRCRAVWAAGRPRHVAATRESADGGPAHPRRPGRRRHFRGRVQGHAWRQPRRRRRACRIGPANGRHQVRPRPRGWRARSPPRRPAGRQSARQVRAAWERAPGAWAARAANASAFLRSRGNLACLYSCSVSHVEQRVCFTSAPIIATTTWLVSRRSRGQ